MKRAWRIWRMPLLLALASCAGLLAALLADGLGDLLSWLALSLVVAMSTVYSLRRPKTPDNTNENSS